MDANARDWDAQPPPKKSTTQGGVVGHPSPKGRDGGGWALNPSEGCSKIYRKSIEKTQKRFNTEPDGVKLRIFDMNR